MLILDEFEARLSDDLRKKFRSLNSPIEIQHYLDGLPYVGEERNRCPLDVMKDGQSHCLDGGLLAALALRRLGDPGLLVDLVPAKDENGQYLDDDHVLAVFRRDGLWGAVAKSNFVWLRYREPVYRTLRELAMSYFEVYYNVDGLKTLRAYTRPFDIAQYDSLNYAWDECNVDKLYQIFYLNKSISLISNKTAATLQPVDKRAFDAGSVGTDWDWVYRPK